MEATKKIKCPKCGAILTVKVVPGIEKAHITCPICKVKSAYTEYKPFVPKQQSDETQYGGDETRYNSDETRYSAPGDETRLSNSANKKSQIGKLIDVNTGRAYQLSLGTNIIGRQATTSTATVQIATDDRHMSRNHAIIEVKRFSDGMTIHYLSNSVNKNPTMVNGKLLENADRIILQHRDILQFGTVNMRFEVE